MRALMRSLAPTSFEDVAALVALYRPGPDGRQHAQRLRRPEERPEAGRVLPPRRRGAPRRHLRPDDLPRVDHAGGAEVRRLLARRGRQPPQGVRQEDPRGDGEGAQGVRRRGRAAPATAPRSGTSLFDIIEQFADYAFNKSHSFGYGFIAYQTAYLKAHYPAEYLSALLTSVKANLDKAAIYLAECRTMGIEVIVPDVNRSLSDFAAGRSPATSSQIVFGLSAVRNVGSGLVRPAPRRAGGQRAVRRLLRLLRARRLPGAQQEDAGVADQGRRRSTASATRARACSAPSSGSSTAPSPAAASATWA